MNAMASVKLNATQQETLAALARQPLCMGRETNEAKGMVCAGSAQTLVVMGLATISESNGRVKVTLTPAGIRYRSLGIS